LFKEYDISYVGISILSRVDPFTLEEIEVLLLFQEKYLRNT